MFSTALWFRQSSRMAPRWKVSFRSMVSWNEILHFVGLISHMCFTLHALRLGGTPDSDRAAGGGIGNFILTPATLEASSVQQPPKCAI